MADNKKYYYMRLKEGFFDDNSMKVLEGLPDGYLYSNVLLKMYLASLKTEGRLMLNDFIPYNAEMIASITRHQVGTVDRALKIFQQLGLIEVLDNGAIYMLNIQNFIGKGSTEADRIRKYQRRIAAEKSEGVEIYGKSTPELEIEIEKELELELELKKEREKESTRHKHGEYKNVLLTDEEYQKLQDEYPNTDEMIENLSHYLKSTGKSYKSHYATIRNWQRREQAKPRDKLQESYDMMKRWSESDDE